MPPESSAPTPPVASAAPDQAVPPTQPVASAAPDQTVSPTQPVASVAPDQAVPPTQPVASVASDPTVPSAQPVASVAPDQAVPPTQPVASEVAAKVAATPSPAPTPPAPPAPRKHSAKKSAAPAPALYGTGRRKAAKSRVFLRPGKGGFQVNGKPVDEFFTRISSRIIARQALQVVGRDGAFDLFVTVRGGGENGQAEAVRHGVARALMAGDPDCKPALRKAGLVTRDSRAVERKKVGLHKARRAKQYSKR